MAIIPSIKPLLAQPYDHLAWSAASGSHLHVRIGNARATTDQSNSLRSIEKLMKRVEEFGADYCDVIKATATSYIETDIRFSDKHGRHQSIPCAMIARFADGQLIDLRIHLDPSPIPGYQEATHRLSN
jgi:hypothetical protein